jgi:hypothetical protein
VQIESLTIRGKEIIKLGQLNLLHRVAANNAAEVSKKISPGSRGAS